MIDKEKLKAASLQWIEYWNNHDIAKVMEHYADDVQFYSPTVSRRWNIEEGKLQGKDAVEKHFQKGLEEVPGMHFSFHSILFGINSVVLFYKRETGILAADVVTFNDEGKVSEVRAFYEEKKL
jgi:hypothetical protein